MPMAVFRFGKTVDALWGSGAATDEVRIEHGVILPVNSFVHFGGADECAWVDVAHVSVQYARAERTKIGVATLPCMENQIQESSDHEDSLFQRST